MVDIVLRLTYNCNLKCAHCCYECEPGRESMSLQTLESVLENIEGPLVTTILLGGGEPFTRPRLLKQAIASIAERREDGCYPNLESVSVQTNGLWAKNPSVTARYLTELNALGLDYIVFTGNDQFHREEAKRRRLIAPEPAFNLLCQTNTELRLQNKRRHRLRMDYKSESHLMPDPIGRARNLPTAMLALTSECEMDNSSLTVSTDGSLYPCGFLRPFSLGSLVLEPLSRIMEQMKRPHDEPWLIATLKKRGLYQACDAEILATNPCIICERVFSTNDETRSR